MKIDNPEEKMERALRLLGGVAVPEGMEERVLRRLAQRRPRVRPAGWWIGRAAFAGGLVAAGLLACVAVLHRSTPPVKQVLRPQEAMPVAARVVAGEMRPREKVLRVARRAAQARSVDVVSFPAPPAPLTEQERLLVRMARVMEAPPRTVVAQAPKEAEVSLTHEEVLLVAVSRVRQDAVIEALDPVRRAEADAREKREFKDFVHEKDGGS